MEPGIRGLVPAHNHPPEQVEHAEPPATSCALVGLRGYACRGAAETFTARGGALSIERQFTPCKMQGMNTVLHSYMVGVSMVRTAFSGVEHARSRGRRNADGEKH